MVSEIGDPDVAKTVDHGRRNEGKPTFWVFAAAKCRKPCRKKWTDWCRGCNGVFCSSHIKKHECIKAKPIALIFKEESAEK